MSEEAKKVGRPRKTELEKNATADVPSNMLSKAFGVERDTNGRWCVVTIQYNVDDGIGQVVKLEPHNDRLIAEEQFKVLAARSQFGTQQ